MNKNIFILIALLLISTIFASANIGNVPHAPIEIQEINDSVVILGNTYTKQVIVRDNVGIVNYTLTNKPTGMNISNFGLITWTPTTVGTFNNIVLNVKDSRLNDTVGDHDSETFSIEVRNNVASVEMTPTTITFVGDRNTTSNSVIVTIKNNGGQPLTNVDVDFLKSNGNVIESNVMTVIGNIPSTLGINEQFTLNLTGKIPEDVDAGVESLYGYMKFTANGTTAPIEKRSNINFKTNSNLEIQEVELYINGDDEETFKSSGKSYDELKEGDEIKLIIKVENTHKDNEMVDVFATLSVKDNSGWDEFVNDEESKEIDIKDGDEEEFEISFIIDADELDEDSEDSAVFTLVIEGEDDETGFTHYDTWTFTLEIEREKDEISITNIRMTPNTVYCTDSQVQIRVDYKNTGSNDQDEGRITISNTQLNIFKEHEFDDIDAKESDDKTFLINIPQNLATGNYNFIVTAYNEDNDETDEEIITLESICRTTNNNNDDEDDEEQEIIIVPPTTNTNDNDFLPSVSGESDFRSSPLYITLLIILVLLVLVGIIMLGIVAVKRK
jgi:hypothetical protein